MNKKEVIALENNETIFESIYPLTIVSDRYNGTYSHGKFTAWNCEPDEIPMAIFGDDMDCYDFWTDAEDKDGSDDCPFFGCGNTIEEAVGNLYIKLKKEDDDDDYIARGVPTVDEDPEFYL